MLVADALERALGGLSGRQVIDVHAGSGATGLWLSARGAVVTLVESHAPSAEQARRAGGRRG